MEFSDAYHKGIRLFNAEQFWHAHEAWEEVWRAERDAERRLFYKGIIQSAAALVHWQRGNPKGLHLNWAKARSKLEQMPPELLGVDVKAFIAAMDRFETGQTTSPPRLPAGATPPATDTSFETKT